MGKRKEENRTKMPNTPHTTVTAYKRVYSMRTRGYLSKETVLGSSPLLGSPSSTESPHCKWSVAKKRNKEETVPRGQSPQRQGQTRPDKAPKAPTSTTHQGTSDTESRQTRDQETFPRLKSNTEAELPPLCVCLLFCHLLYLPRHSASQHS